MKTISFASSQKIQNPGYIDLRTPGEFAEGSIPGAVNIPLFGDEEYTRLGRVYREESPRGARFLGLNIIAPRLSDLMENLATIFPLKTPVIFCALGGMRSLAVEEVAGLLDIPGFRLEGGYREFRRFILEFLENYNNPRPLITLHGLAGAGKTEVLILLEREGLPVLNLEQLAGHRGSVFGHLGFSRRVGQKKFDALLWKKLEQLGSHPLLLIEGESKRLGDVYLPEFLLEEKRKAGINIFLDSPREERVNCILRNYCSKEGEEELIDQARKALYNIEKKLIKRAGKKTWLKLQKALERKDFFDFTFILLRDYYDPLYSRYLQKIPSLDLVIEEKNPERAAEKVRSFLQKKNFYLREWFLWPKR